MKFAVRIIVIALLALAAIGNAALGAGIVLTREPGPRPLTAERVATASKPAIVFIQSNYTITTSMPQPAPNQDALDKALQPRVDDGEITTEAQWLRAADQLVFANPANYYYAGNTVTDTWDDWATGSGFFVTEDGYLVTAAHVVSASKSEIHDGIVADTKTTSFVSDFKNSVKKDWASYGPSDSELNTFVAFWQNWIADYTTVTAIDAKYYIGSGPSVQAGDGIQASGMRASVVSIDPTIGGHDIAILKANVSGGVPALSIATSDPNPGDATYAMGYPRTAYLQETVPTNQAVPIATTVGKIQHMNSRTSSGGSWKVYGTDAQFTHGDSGGPVLDAHGDVMGVISYIIPDASGNQLPGQGYFVPSSFIKEDLAKANVTIAADPTRSDLTNTYYRALAKGDDARYKEELNLLLSIQGRASMDPYVGDAINIARTQIVLGNDKTPPELTGYVLPGAGAAAGVILLALLSWLVMALAVGRRPKNAIVAIAPVVAVAPELPAVPEPEPPAVLEPEPAAVAALPAD